jgi:hypothetical protein
VYLRAVERVIMAMNDEHPNSHVQFSMEVDNEYLTNIACIFLQVFNVLYMMTLQCLEFMSDKCKIVMIILVEIMKNIDQSVV